MTLKQLNLVKLANFHKNCITILLILKDQEKEAEELSGPPFERKKIISLGCLGRYWKDPCEIFVANDISFFGQENSEIRLHV